LTTNSYDYWHWGPDEVLDARSVGYASGAAYALTSLSNSFRDIAGWLPAANNGGGLKMTVAPYFNATREASVQAEAQVGVQTAGDDKLGPFPHWILSTQTPDKLYNILTLPVSDWYIGSQVGQAMEDGHTMATMQALVDYYYGLGALINLYCHSSSDGSGAAGAVASQYVTYSVAKPLIWSTNAAGIYNWWQKRGTAGVTASYAAQGSQATDTTVISGSGDPGMAVEFYMPGASYYGLQVLTNGVTAGAAAYRTSGQLVKVQVGTAVTNAQVVFQVGPTALNDVYSVMSGNVLTVTAPGVLGNDANGTATGSLTATRVSGPAHGALSLAANGAVMYTPAAGYAGVDAFTYQASDGQTNSAITTANMMVVPPGYLFYDNMARPTGTGCLLPWVQQLGAWNLTNGMFTGTSSNTCYGNAYCANSNWTDYTVQAQIQFSGSNAFGGGIGGRLNPATGARYAAWVYPEGSVGGSLELKLIKFEGWTTWSSTPMASVGLSAVGTNVHTLALAMQGANLTVYLDGVQMLNTPDNNFDGVPAYANGGITADLFSAPGPSSVSFRNVVATTLGGAPLIQSLGVTNRVFGLTWSAVAGGTYQVQYKDNLGIANWTALVPNIVATGPTATATNSITNSPQRFYRIVLMP
jgi:hypothetical protein